MSKPHNSAVAGISRSLTGTLCSSAVRSVEVFWAGTRSCGRGSKLSARHHEWSPVMHRRSPNNPLRLWLLPVLRSRALRSQSRTAFQTCHCGRENGGIVRPRRSCGFGSEKSAPRLNIPQAVKNRVANVCCRLAALRLFALCAFRIIILVVASVLLSPAMDRLPISAGAPVKT